MKKLFIASAIILAIASMLMISCSGGGNPRGSTPGNTSATSSKTAIISGTVTISSGAAASMKPSKLTSYQAAAKGSSMDKTLSAAGVKNAVQLPPLINATLKLYNADRPDWIYPVAQVFTDSQGKFKLDTLTNADLNTSATGAAEYKDGDPVTAGNYTLIAANDTTITGGKQFVAVQAFVKYFEGTVTGNDLVVQDSDAQPSVSFVIGLKPNSKGNFGGTSARLAPNAGIQIVFDMAMARLSVIDAVNVYSSGSTTTPIPGSWKFTPDLLSGTFYPTGGLTPSTDYTVTIQGGDKNAHAAVNVYGKAIPAIVTCTFKSEASNDTTPPQNLVLYRPQQTNVAITTPIQIASPEPIDINSMTVTSSPSIGDKPSIQYIGTKPVMLNQADYYIYEIGHTPLSLNTNYNITISNVRDMAGNQISPLTFTFKTEASSSGVTTTAGALQTSQIAIKDVFGKWVNAMNARNAALLTTYMTGDFYWLTSGWSPDDLNHDGRLTLNEFRGMLVNSFADYDYCGTVISGDTSDITINGALSDITFKLSYLNTLNLTDPDCAAQPDQTMYAELDNINSAWLIRRGSDSLKTSYPSPLDVINLVAPANGTAFAEPTPSKPLYPDFAWTAVAGVKTYAVLVMEKGTTDKGWVALVDASLYASGDQASFTFSAPTGTIVSGATGTSYVMPSGSLFGFSKSISKYIPGGYYVWSVLGFKTSTVSDFALSQVTDPKDDLNASSSPYNFSVANNAPPSVLDVTPPNTSTDVTTSPTLTAAFSEAMDATTLNATTFTLATQEGAPVSGTVTYDTATDIAKFIPTSNLAYATSYVAKISTGAKDIAANSLAVDFSWGFKTKDAPDTTAPVTTANPAGGTYNSTINVALSSSENVKYILYSTDLSSPTTTYTSPIAVTTDTTLKFFAEDLAGNKETVKTETYTVDTTKPITTVSPAGGYHNTIPFTVTLTTEAGAKIYLTNDGSEPTTGLASSTTTTTVTINATGGTQLKFFAVDSAGNAESVRTEAYVVDTTAPDTFITSNPPNPTTLPNANFTFQADETATFECSLDLAAFAACTSPYSAVISEAAHTFKVRATDLAGNVDATPASFTWTRDVTPPTGSITISSGATYTTGSTVSLAFTYSDNLTTVEQMQISNDGKAWYDPEQVVATKSWTLTPGDGLKAVFVRFKDSAGNWSGPFNATITLDTTDPNTTIDSAPSDPSTNLNGKVFFSASEPASQFECKLTNVTDTTVTINWTISNCTSGSFPPNGNLVDGKRFTVDVRATDQAGRVDATPATYTWSVDTTALTTIASPVGGLYNADQSVTLTATGVAGSCTAAITYCTGNACTPLTVYVAPISISAAAGTRADTVLRFHAVESGTCGSPENEVVREMTYTIDKQLPTVTITNGPPASTNVQSATFYFYASETSTFQCQLDTGGYFTCSSPMTYTNLSEGPHTFYVKATDQATNTGTAAQYSWTVDTTAPTGTVAMTDYYTGSPSYATNTNRYVTLTFNSAASDVYYAMVSNDNSSYYYYTWSSLSPGSGSTRTMLWQLSPGEGNKTLYVKFRDSIGNETSLPTSAVIYLDTTPPNTTIYSYPSSPTTSRTVYIYFNATEPATFECNMNNTAWSACTNPFYFSTPNDGIYTFYVRAKDNSGQYDPTPASYTWTLFTGYWDSPGLWDYSSWGN